MKILLILAAMVLSSTSFAANKNYTCTAGTGENAAKFEIETTKVVMSANGEVQEAKRIAVDELPSNLVAGAKRTVQEKSVKYGIAKADPVILDLQDGSYLLILVNSTELTKSYLIAPDEIEIPLNCKLN
jgi:hypothetical protein